MANDFFYVEEDRLLEDPEDWTGPPRIPEQEIFGREIGMEAVRQATSQATRPPTRAQEAWGRAAEASRRVGDLKANRPKPGFWRNLAAVAAGTGVGYVQNMGRVRPQPGLVGSTVENIRFGGYNRKVADAEQARVESEREARAVQEAETIGRQDRREAAYDDFMAAQATKMRQPPVLKPPPAPPTEKRPDGSIWERQSDGTWKQVVAPVPPPKVEDKWTNVGTDAQGFKIERNQRGETRRVVGPDGKPIRFRDEGVGDLQEKRRAREDAKDAKNDAQRSEDKRDDRLKTAESTFSAGIAALNNRTFQAKQAIEKDTKLTDEEIRARLAKVDEEHAKQQYQLEDALHREKVQSERSMSSRVGGSGARYIHPRLQRQGEQLPAPPEVIQEYADKYLNGNVEEAIKRARESQLKK